MTPEFGDELWEAFNELLELPPERRSGHAHERYADEPALRAELLSLLEHHQDPDGILGGATLDALRALRRAGTGEGRLDALRALAGTVLAGRYELRTELGSGGAGVVYRAWDRLGDEPVAVKLLPPRPADERSAARPEATALRLLRVAGVVQLREDGVLGGEDGCAYLVTDLVEGVPFGADGTPQPWADVAYTAAALLETLDRIHWSGVVHRDIKPGNVLVRPDGTPVVLDLGISAGAHRAVDAGVAPRAGTLRYMAPEQVRDGTACARSDLYAAAAVLHEVLTGRPFRTHADVQALLGSGTVPPATPVAGAAPQTPARVAAVLEAMLAEDPARRPASARSVLAGLFPEARPRSGPDRERLPGLGDSQPASPESLRPLFAGHDRLHHLREDASQELWRRTRGGRTCVLEELERWQRAGLGRWEETRFSIGRAGLETLRAGVRLTTPAVHGDAAQRELDDADRGLLAVVELAGRRAAPGLVARVLARDAADVEARLAHLADRGFVARDASDQLETLRVPAGTRTWLDAHAPDLHRRIAQGLQPGDVHRLQHLIAAGDGAAVAREAACVARARIAVGRVEAARSALLDGLRALGPDADPEAANDLLELLLYATLQVGTGDALDHMLYQLGRWPGNARTARLEGITRAVLHVLGGEGERALAEMPGPEAAHTDLERRCCVSARLFAARSRDAPTQLRLIEEAERLARSAGSPGVHAAASSARAWLRYAEERFEEAAGLHIAAAELAADAATRASARLNAASAYLEAGRFDRAEAQARAILVFARRHRLAPFEARAEWLTRAAAYRRGDVGVQPDPELARAAREVRMPNVAALIALNEAAIAWRSDQLALGAQLARDAAEIWRGVHRRWPVVLASALAAACAPGLERTSAASLLEELRACPLPTIAAQATALLVLADARLANGGRPFLASLVPQLEGVDPAVRLEVLSLDEVMKSAAPDGATQ